MTSGQKAVSRGEAVEAVNKQTDRRSLLPLSQIVMMMMMMVMVKMMVMVVVIMMLMTMIEMMSEQTIAQLSQVMMMIIQPASIIYDKDIAHIHIAHIHRRYWCIPYLYCPY